MSSNMSEDHEIALTRMPQQEGVQAPKDDWTGTIDRVQRRKLQNRLNQRSYRLRKKQQQTDKDQAWLRKNAIPIPSNATPPIQIERDAVGFTCSIAPPEIHSMMRQFESLALQSYVHNSPTTDHLLSLSKLNIQRAIIENIHSVGMTMEWTQRDESISIFNMPTPQLPELLIPPSLRPTQCQRLIPHHPWLDFFPFPNMRDNLIAVQDLIDDDDLCHDLMAFWDTRNTDATMLVWGPSWEPDNWEVTPAFLKKWGFLLRGCEDLIRSTNRWRAQRGEKYLSWKSTLAMVYTRPISQSEDVT
ncbi:hypothetical protein N7452_003165 [Penicillium brevicompactum]|uniref:BZIP domain-containing protein n=1 Tax=Penicillium brevicompactum TaxID=5074 RepID=A0A9W9UJW8_PENBR|nr:hypothetical protein N7452_003165 [Penicillium brevicompactum]